LYQAIFGVLLPSYKYVNVPERDNVTEVSFTDTDETEMGNSEKLEGENLIHDEETEGGKSKTQQPTGIKKGWKIKKLTSIDIGKILGILDINQ